MKRLFRFLYRLLPFKKQFFLFLKLFWDPSERVFMHLHFKGPFRASIRGEGSFILFHGGNHIENGIFWKGLPGGFEKESMRLWIELCKESSVIFDLGANSGVYSLVAKAVNPQARVFAFEPHPVFFSLLEKKKTLNGFDLNIHKVAVSDADGKITVPDFSQVQKGFEVDSVRLDTFISTQGIEKLDIIKIDVESFEPYVLKGFENYLPRFRPAFLIEVLNDEIGKIIEQRTAGLNYLYFSIDEAEGVKRVSSILKGTGLNYLLCDLKTAHRLELPMD
jgi:FkbM family methyltransferase